MIPILQEENFVKSNNVQIFFSSVYIETYRAYHLLYYVKPRGLCHANIILQCKRTL